MLLISEESSDFEEDLEEETEEVKFKYEIPILQVEFSRVVLRMRI